MKQKIMLVVFASIALLAGIALNNENLFGANAETDKKNSAIVTLTSSNFEEETSNGLVLVDFWAPWCGPCRKMNPILEELATEWKDSVKVAKLNVDNYKKLAIDKGVEALPTIIVYKDGKEVNRIVGLSNKEELKASILK